MARAEHVWLQAGTSGLTPTVSPLPFIQRMTSFPLELSCVSFTLPAWRRTRFCTGCPCMNSSSSRAKLLALAHDAISRHSSRLRPEKSAEAHISTTRSASVESGVDAPAGAKRIAVIRPDAICHHQGKRIQTPLAAPSIRIVTGPTPSEWSCLKDGTTSLNPLEGASTKRQQMNFRN